MLLEDKMWDLDKDGDVRIHLPTTEDYTLYLTQNDLIALLEAMLDFRKFGI